MVDLIACENMGSNILLTKKERFNLAHVLHDACMIDGHKMTILSAIDIMSESLNRCYLEESTTYLKLPTVIPIESMELVNE